MDDNLERMVSRRTILKEGACAGLGLTGLVSQLFTMRAAASVIDSIGFDDYRAIVCVFLFGGNDSGNTVIPIDGGEENYDVYAGVRSQLAIARASLDDTIIAPVNTGGRRFALHPALSSLGQLFESGGASIVANVGSLVYPMTGDDYINDTVEKPPSLFAHDIQQQQWQISTADAQHRLGWGGRIADVLHAAGVNPSGNVSMNISLAGTNFFQTGNEVSPFVLTPIGATELTMNGLWDTGDMRDVLEAAYVDLMALQQSPTYSQQHIMQKVYADISESARLENELVAALLQAPPPVTPRPQNNGLAAQLEMVARMIQQRSGLGHQRQIFFCALGGFDNHNGIIGPTSPHANNLVELDGALKYFWDVLGELGMRDQVTTFTASDFGRTMTSNDDGSDHGWGGHHFVMGGSQLRGRRMFGSFPTLTLEGPDDVGRGRYVPSTSVDAFSFEMARWLGVPLSEMTTVFPNLTRFLDVNDPSTQLRVLT